MYTESNSRILIPASKSASLIQYPTLLVNHLVPCNSDELEYSCSIPTISNKPPLLENSYNELTFT